MKINQKTLARLMDANMSPFPSPLRPEPKEPEKEEEKKPLTYRFDITRDDQGRIASITATPVLENEDEEEEGEDEGETENETESEGEDETGD